MSRTRIKVNENLERLREHLLEQLLGAPHGASAHTFRPPTDALETEHEFIIRMALAGVNREDLSVSTEGDVLRISGFRRDDLPPGRKIFHKMEIPVGPFERRFRLPPGCNSAEITATWEAGMLEVRVPIQGGEPPHDVEITVS